MAGGGKETPRQKMVGMMYLVLTALLALQVSNSVLDKFVFIDESLKHTIEITRKGNDGLIEGIKSKVKQNGGRADDQAILTRAEKAKEKTSAILHELDVIRTKIIEVTGGNLKDDQGKDIPGSYAGAKDYDMVMNLMIGAEGAKNGIGYDMEKKMDKYREEMQAMVDSVKIDDLTPPAKDIAQFKNNPDQKEKDFVELSFDHTPMVASLAVLSQMQSEIARTESKVINRLAEKIGAGQLKFDKVMAVISAESKVVAAGTPYKAKMFIAASSSTTIPRMTSTAGGVKVENTPSGYVGTVEFIARPAGSYVDGKAKAEWKGSISIKTPRGDTTFNVTEEYFVAQPVIQVQAGAISALYMNCGNELSIQVPALASNYDPAFTATGATLIPGQKKGFVIVVPTAPQVSINVSSGGNLIGTEKFGVKGIPKPTVQMLDANGKVLDQKVGGACPRGLVAKAIPDKSFAEQNPKDARYEVSEWKVTLARGKRPVGEEKYNGSRGNLANAAKAQAGDRLFIEVSGVTRTNFQGKTEKVPGIYETYSYPIN